MQNSIYYIVLLGILSFAVGMVVVPIVRKIAVYFRLVDQPNYRKVHTKPIPLVGGITLAFVVFTNLFLSQNSVPIFHEFSTILAGAFLLLIVGVIDDKNDLNAKYKLLIQLILAFAVAHSGIRINSLYGFFGYYEIHLYLQYIITVLVITGVVNAFNLMDGVDGLVGSLTLLGFVLLLFASWLYNSYTLMVLSVLFIGALVSFLHFNFSQQQKIFMGDSGSLFLGFVLVTLGIKVLQMATSSASVHTTPTLLCVIAFFIIPVFDSLRVYIGRMKKGKSPFKADKSHLHHLLLIIGLSHKKIAITVVIMALSLFALGFLLITYFSKTMILLALIISFSIVIRFLLLISSMFLWRQRIQTLENQ